MSDRRPKVTISQCADWCCEDRPFSDRWWNAHLESGIYESAETPTAAYLLAVSRAQKMGVLR